MVNADDPVVLELLSQRVAAALAATTQRARLADRADDACVLLVRPEGARALRRPKLAGVVNACLRRFQRENLAAAPADSEEARWNHPAWLIERLRQDWPDRADAILEAAAAGLPVLAGSSGGSPETVVPGETGFVVHSIADIVAGLDILVADPARARDMGAKGRRRVVDEYVWDRVVARLRDGYRS